jgi:DNA-directed RNA polymerase subunit RPC12/RpoP
MAQRVILCSKCGAPIEVPDLYVKARVECPNCGTSNVRKSLVAPARPPSQPPIDDDSDPFGYAKSVVARSAAAPQGNPAGSYPAVMTHPFAAQSATHPRAGLIAACVAGGLSLIIALSIAAYFALGSSEPRGMESMPDKASWHRFTPPSGVFSVSFPGAPLASNSDVTYTTKTIGPKDITTTGKAKLTLYHFKNRHAATEFEVTYFSANLQERKWTEYNHTTGQHTEWIQYFVLDEWDVSDKWASRLGGTCQRVDFLNKSGAEYPIFEFKDAQNERFGLFALVKIESYFFFVSCVGPGRESIETAGHFLSTFEIENEIYPNARLKMDAKLSKTELLIEHSDFSIACSCSGGFPPYKWSWKQGTQTEIVTEPENCWLQVVDETFSGKTGDHYTLKARWSGIPQTGSYQVRVEVSDSKGYRAESQFTISVGRQFPKDLKIVVPEGKIPLGVDSWLPLSVNFQDEGFNVQWSVVAPSWVRLAGIDAKGRACEKNKCMLLITPPNAGSAIVEITAKTSSMYDRECPVLKARMTIEVIDDLPNLASLVGGRTLFVVQPWGSPGNTPIFPKFVERLAECSSALRGSASVTLWTRSGKTFTELDEPNVEYGSSKSAAFRLRIESIAAPGEFAGKGKQIAESERDKCISAYTNVVFFVPGGESTESEWKDIVKLSKRHTTQGTKFTIVLIEDEPSNIRTTDLEGASVNVVRFSTKNQ